MAQLYALLVLAGVGYFIYLAWGILVLLVTAPRGTFSDALEAASFDADDDEEDRQRRRRRRRAEEDEEESEASHRFLWDDD